MLVVDNSQSMVEEVAAIEENINTNFADILERSGSDYRVILLSKHRSEDGLSTRAERTAICVTAPLSSLSECPSLRPGTSERFLHYDLPVESTDSLRLLLANFHSPSIAGSGLESGWSQWLRPRAKKVFLEVTDDDTAMTAEAFIRELTTMAPEHFGANELDPQFVFHSIVGLREKSVPSNAYAADEPRTALRCRSDSAQVRNAGLGYQLLSRLTSGLRFPICRADLFDTVFHHISQDVLRKSGVSCAIDIPEPPSNRELELDNLELAYRSAVGAEPLTLRQARVASDCGADAFRIVNGRIQLCPQACGAINAQPGPTELVVRFTCLPSYIIR